MDISNKLRVLEEYKQGDLLITVDSEPEEKVFVERIKKVGMLEYIKVDHKRDILVSSVTKIRDPKSREVLYPLSRTES